MNAAREAPRARRQQALGATVLLLTTLAAYSTVRAPDRPAPPAPRAEVPDARPAAPRDEAPPGTTPTPAPTVRLADIEAHVRAVARRYGVSPALVAAIIEAESEFNPRAVSRTGARGLMQLMPATASSLDVEDVHDPYENVEAGVRHLRRLLDRFDGALPLALAAYNAGEQAVLAYGGIPPYPETQRYVRRILRRIGRGDLADVTRRGDAGRAPDTTRASAVEGAAGAEGPARSRDPGRVRELGLARPLEPVRRVATVTPAAVLAPVADPPGLAAERPVFGVAGPATRATGGTTTAAEASRRPEPAGASPRPEPAARATPDGATPAPRAWPARPDPMLQSP